MFSTEIEQCIQVWNDMRWVDDYKLIIFGKTNEFNYMTDIEMIVLTLYMTTQIKRSECHSCDGQLLWCWEKHSQLWAMPDGNDCFNCSNGVLLGCNVGTCCPNLSSLSMCSRVVFPALSSPRKTSFPDFLYKPARNKHKIDICRCVCVIYIYIKSSKWMLHTGGGWGETPPHMIVKCFGCMAIQNKSAI